MAKHFRNFVEDEQRRDQQDTLLCTMECPRALHVHRFVFFDGTPKFGGFGDVLRQQYHSRAQVYFGGK